MSPSRTNLLAGGALALVLAGAGGFGLARCTAARTTPTEASKAAEADEHADGEAGGEPKELALPPEAIRAAEIEVVPAYQGAFEAELLAPGTVAATPAGQAVLTARAPGAITRLDKRLGDAVRAGEPVAVIESREAAQITADRSVASAKLRLAQQNLGRERRLYEEKVSPRVDLEQAQAAVAEAAAEARRAQTAAGAARVAGDGRSVVVSSPISGRITAVAPVAGLGAYVQPETELFRVADPRRVQIEAAVTAADAARITPGDHAAVNVDGREFRVFVRSLTPGVDAQTRSVTVVLTADAPLDLQPGRLVQVRLHLHAPGAPETVVVPDSAVQTLGDKTYVFIRTAKGFLPRRVMAGRRNDGRVEIISGLKAGEPVATKNAFLLKAEIGKSAVGDDD